MKRIIRNMLLVLFFTSVPILDCLIVSVIASGDQDMAQFLLDKILQNRGKVKNFKCMEMALDYRSKDQRKRFYERALKRGRQQEAEELLRKEYILTRNRLAFDNEGRARVEWLSGESDRNGNLIKPDYKRIITWDGKSSIVYGEDPGVGSSAKLGDKKPFEASERYRQVWRTFGGNFCTHLTNALKENTEIKIDREQGGNYRIEIVYEEEGRKRVGVVDPTQGYSVKAEERYYQGKLTEGYKAKHREVRPGIWFPVEGEYIRGDPASPYAKATIKITEITVNDPNFYDGLFHVDFPKGTYVFDLATGIQYRVGDPMSQKFYDDPNSRSVGEIVKDELEKIVVEGPQKGKSEPIELFIPKAALALEKNTPFVLNLSNHKLINPFSKPDSEKAHKHLTKLGKGDIAWDGTIVPTRGAKVLTTKKESHQPLKFTKAKWSSSYKLPEKVELPYSMLVITGEGENYLMTIHKIEPDGIRITYRRLNPDETRRYKQKAKNS